MFNLTSKEDELLSIKERYQNQTKLIEEELMTLQQDLKRLEEAKNNNMLRISMADCNEFIREKENEIVSLKYYLRKASNSFNDNMTDVSIIKPPASLLYAVIDFVYSKKSKERIFDCILADMYEELYSALDEKKLHKAKWVRIKTNLLLIQAMLGQVPNAILKKAVDIFKPSGD